MLINLELNSLNATCLTVVADTGLYALVTMDGDNAGVFSVLIVPESGWDDDAVKANVLEWFNLTETP